MAQGSSPRMRGAHGDVWKLGEAQGIIPADAGSTWPTMITLAIL